MSETNSSYIHLYVGNVFVLHIDCKPLEWIEIILYRSAQCEKLTDTKVFNVVFTVQNEE